jgi:DNA-binding MarR family transcriptional regulator
VTEPRWLDATEERAWRSLIQMSWLLDAAISRDLAQQASLSHADYYVLARLSESPQHTLRMSELAAGINWSKSRLSHQIARMEQRGLVCRRGCPSDARGTYAVLTPKGLKAIQEAAPGHVESIRRHLIDQLSRNQLDALADVAELVVARLGGNGLVAPECPNTGLHPGEPPAQQ